MPENRRTFATGRGRPFPLGVTAARDGLNFALLCRHGTRVTLVILPGDGRQRSRTRRDPPRPASKNRTGDHWHIRVDGLPDDVLLRLAGRRPARAAAPLRPDRRPARPGRHRCSPAAAVWAGTCETDPQRDQPPQPVLPRRRLRLGRRRPAADPARRHDHLRAARPRLHLPPVRAASRTPAPSAAWSRRSRTCKWLGVTAVELLPVHEFDESDCPFVNPQTGEKLRNFWGYNTHRLRRPKAAYAATGDGARPGQRVPRDGQGLPRRRHRGHPRRRLQPHRRGRRPRPTYSFRGLDNELYYMLDDRRPLPELLRLRQHGQLQPPGRPRPAPDLPALLGRPTCTSTASASTWPRSSAATAAGNVLVEPPVDRDASPRTACWPTPS